MPIRFGSSFLFPIRKPGPLIILHVICITDWTPVKFLLFLYNVPAKRFDNDALRGYFCVSIQGGRTRRLVSGNNAWRVFGPATAAGGAADVR
jgi:hypothetical protein